jgi:outer membrane protein
MMSHPQTKPIAARGRVATRWLSIVLLGVLLGLLASGPARAETRLSLADAVATARRHRSEVGQAELDVQLARLGVLNAGLQRIRLTLEGRATAQIEQLYVNASPELCASVEGLCQPAARTRLYDFSANLSIPLWTGWGLESGWSRARQLERASLAQRQAQLRTLTLEATRAYWAVRWADLQRVAAQQALERRSTVAAIIKARADAGIAPKPDLLRAQIAVLRQQAQLAEIDGRVSEAHAALAAALQIEGDVTLTEDPARQAPAQASALADALAQAARQRPELERARAEAEAQAKRVSQIEGDYWPHLSLFGRAEARNEAFGVPQPNLIGNYSAGVTLSWLAFDSLSTYESARGAELERRKLALESERIARVVESEVRAAHGRMVSALARREPLEKARSLAETTVELIRRRYQSGGALLLEVLSAQEELEALESACIDSSIAVAEAQAGLDAAVGRR